ncbi:MAG: hypothetical protein LBG95_08250 [Treponema sp.]|jgi:hypothetical protein|nr:hypothetical protein [Treponema sp.]
MRKTSGDEGCHSKNAVPRHGVFAMTGPRMLVFAYTSFHAFVVIIPTILVSKFALQIIYGFVQTAGEKRVFVFGDFYVPLYAPLRVGDI